MSQNYLISVTATTSPEHGDEQFHCSADTTLLVGMEKAQNQALSVGCRGGGCGVCRIRVLRGEYESKRMSRAHVSEQEQQNGVALACRILPRSDLLICAEPRENEC